MKLNLKSSQLINLIIGVVFLNIVFLAGTYLFNYYYYNIQNANWQNGSVIKYILKELSLASENVLATWYSSILLFFAGLIFFFCYLIQKEDLSKKVNKKLSYGWLVFAGIFALLSLDEMTSLHERLGNISALNPLEDYVIGWVALLAVPIVLVGGFMIWFCLLQVKRAPLAALFAVGGTLLFGSIPVQEYFEMNTWQAVDYSDAWQRPVGFLLLEEGSELFGATLMMISGLLFAYYLSAGKKYSPGTSLELNLHLNNRNTVIQYAAGSLVLALLMLVIVNNELLILEGEITDLGKRENWFPAATAFLSFLLCLYLYLKDIYTGSQKVFLYLGFFSILISAYFGGNLYEFMENPTESIYKILILSVLILTTIGLSISMFNSVKDFYTRAAVLIWACLLIPGFVVFSWYSAALIFAGYSFISVSLIHRITSKVPVTSGLPVTENS